MAMPRRALPRYTYQIVVVDTAGIEKREVNANADCIGWLGNGQN